MKATSPELLSLGYTSAPVLAWSRPSYGPAPDRSIDNSHMAAVMFAGNGGIKWAGPVCPDRVGWRLARNSVVEEVLEYADQNDLTGVVWTDDDVLVPRDAYWRLATSGHDLIGALYFQRAAPYLPVVGKLMDDEKRDFDFWWDYPADVISPVDGFGFGCCYTSVKVLRAVAALPAAAEGLFSVAPHAKAYGEDFLFCLRAKAAGFQPYLDSGIRCRHHLDSRWADEELFKRFRGDLLPPAGEFDGMKVVEEAEDPYAGHDSHITEDD